jgi:hypothetical protein
LRLGKPDAISADWKFTTEDARVKLRNSNRHSKSDGVLASLDDDVVIAARIDGLTTVFESSANGVQLVVGHFLL